MKQNADKKGIITKLQERWQVNSAWQVLVILLVFACTGFSVMYLKTPFYALAGIDETTPTWIKVLYYSVTILPAYQIVLLFYGFIFGQFQFFWNFEKRLAKRIFGRFIK